MYSVPYTLYLGLDKDHKQIHPVDSRAFSATYTHKKKNKNIYYITFNLVHSCYVLRVRPMWFSFLSLPIHTYTIIHIIYVCMLFTSTKKTKV